MLSTGLHGWQWLAASSAVLLLGPAVVWLAARWRNLLDAVDGFVLIAVGGLVATDALPEAVQKGGWPVVLLAVVGFVGPTLLEVWLHRAARAVHTAALSLGLIGLCLHAGLDGVVLGHTHGDAASNLATAVLLHRLPEGLTIWWLLAPGYGVAFAALVLACVAAATAGGMYAADSLAFLHSSGGMGWTEALVAGSLLHVVVHRPHPLVAERQLENLRSAGTWRWASGLGGLAGLALLSVALPSDEPEFASRVKVFLDLATDSAPALLLAYVAAGVVQAYLPAAGVRWMARGSRLSRACRGAAFGLPLPICSCGVVPVYRSLVVQGVPAAAALAFLVATPELGLDAVLLSLPLLGPAMTVARVLAAFTLALIMGAVLGGYLDDRHAAKPERPHDDLLGKPQTASWRARLSTVAQIGLVEMVDHTGPWILLGLAIAAAVQPLLSGSLLLQLPPGLDVVLWGFAGMPMYVCASGATPLVAVLLAAGVSPGAGLAFLLTGPATNIATVGMLGRLHGRSMALAYAGGMTVLAVLAGYLANVLLGASSPVAPSVPAVHDHGLLGQLALLGLAALLLISWLRQGPRGFLGQIMDLAAGSHGHRHSHSHDHSHDHSHGAHSLRVRVPDGHGRAVGRLRPPRHHRHDHHDHHDHSHD